MIDISKYEWDSECRMVVINGELYQRGSNGDYHLSLHEPAVAQIIADAPLLLAEVKRLREEIKTVADFVSWVKETHPHYYHQLMNAYERRHKQ